MPVPAAKLHPARGFTSKIIPEPTGGSGRADARLQHVTVDRQPAASA
jgi:hypothetical protein